MTKSRLIAVLRDVAATARIRIAMPDATVVEVLRAEDQGEFGLLLYPARKPARTKLKMDQVFHIAGRTGE